MATYEGGEMLEQGLADLGAGVAQALDRYHKRKQQDMQGAMASDMMMGRLARTPDPSDPTGKKMIVDPNALKRYTAYSQAQRAAIGAGMKSALEVSQIIGETADKHLLSEAQRRRDLAAANRDVAEGPGQPTNIDPIPGRPGWGIVRKTGQLIATTNDAARQEAPQIDPSGKFYMTYEKGQWTWKPLPSATMVLPGMGVQPGTAPSTFNVSTDQGGSNSRMQNRGTPSKGKGAGQPATDTDTGTAAPAADTQDQANEIRRKYKAGEMNKEDALKALKQLGFN
jgi:hypothetical protein